MLDKKTYLDWHVQAVADREDCAAIVARGSVYAPVAEDLRDILSFQIEALEVALEYLDFPLPEASPTR